MVSRRICLDPALVPSINTPDKVLRFLQNPESYTTAPGFTAQPIQATEPLTQPNSWSIQPKDNDAQPMETQDVSTTRAGLRLLIVNELGNNKVTLMKEAMMQGIEETFWALRAPMTESRTLFFRFLEMALRNMTHQGTLDSILFKAFDWLSQSDVFMDALVERVGKHSVRFQLRSEKCLKSDYVENVTKGHHDETVSPLQLETESWSMKSNEDSMTQRGHVRSQKREKRKCTYRQHRCESKMPQISLFFLGILDNENE